MAKCTICKTKYGSWLSPFWGVCPKCEENPYRMLPKRFEKYLKNKNQ